MGYLDTGHLRVLIATERERTLALVASRIAALGHEVVVAGSGGEVPGLVEKESPDLALVGLGEPADGALDLIRQIVRSAVFPVVAVPQARDTSLLAEASKRGIFGYISGAEGEDWQSAIDIVLRRFADYRGLRDAFERRAVVERAKGILMERHSVAEGPAFEMLRAEARATSRKVGSVARAVVEGHRLLPKGSGAGAGAGA